MIAANAPSKLNLGNAWTIQCVDLTGVLDGARDIFAADRPQWNSDVAIEDCPCFEVALQDDAGGN